VVVCIQSQREQPDGVDGNGMEMKASTTAEYDDGEHLVDATNSSWMSTLPEVSTLDYSPGDASTDQLTTDKQLELDDDDRPPEPPSPYIE